MHHFKNLPLGPARRGALLTVLKHLELETKCHLQGVCRIFRAILRNPSKGSFVWQSINVNDQVFRWARPPVLAGWLIQRVHGIRSVLFQPEGPERHVTFGQVPLVPPTPYDRHIVVNQLFPQLSALLSPEADSQLDLRFATAEELFGSQEQAVEGPHRYDIARSYWANLAGSLTVQSLRYQSPLGHATTSALNQLARLQKLSLVGAEHSRTPSAGGHIELALPQLESLTIARFLHVRVSLSCPRLQSLEMEDLRPLEALEGIPQGIMRVWLKGLELGPLSLQDILHGHRLQNLTSLGIVMAPGLYDNPTTLELFRQVFRHGRLATLRTNCPLEKLAPLEGPGCPLPSSLQSLALDVPLGRGIPVFLEQLTNLRRLVAVHTGVGPMHLDRPLDPFLNMAHLRALIFGCADSGRSRQAESFSRWTPDALKFFGLASRRILEGSLMPCGRKVTLKYTDQWQELAKHWQASGLE